MSVLGIEQPLSWWSRNDVQILHESFTELVGLDGQEFYNKNHDEKGRFASSGGTISVIRGDIQRERKAILKELDAQGIEELNPLRHIFQSWMGNSVVVVRNAEGQVRGGVQFQISRTSKQVAITDMRMLDKRQGHGTQALTEVAKTAAALDFDLAVYSAIGTAKPFYSKLGAYFQSGSSVGHWTDATRDALAKGNPIAGGEVTYDELLNVPLFAASSRPRKKAVVGSISDDEVESEAFYNKNHDSAGRFARSPESRATDPLAQPDSGFTLAVPSLEPITEGFAVALGGSDRLFLAADSFDGPRPKPAMVKAVRERIDAAMAIKIEGATVGVGGWHNPDDGKLEVNVTAVFPTNKRADAVLFAKTEDQIAIFALHTGELISTGGTGGDRSV